MESSEKDRILSYHRKRLGLSPLRALGWRSPQCQILRFDALCGWGDLSGCSVMDVGCGHGCLKPYLDGRFSGVSYLGIDLMGEFVDEARRRHGHLADTRFLQADFLAADLPIVDLVFACGSLNYKTENVLYPFQAIDRLWSLGGKGIAFNMLDDSNFGDDPFLCGQNPDEIISYCRNLDPQAELVVGRDAEDFTVLMRR